MSDLKPTDELTQPELTQRILRIIAETQRKDAAQVTIDSSFEELGIDSMDGINIIFALENEFNINVPDEEVKNIRSVRDVVEGAIRLIEAGAAHSENQSKAANEADGGAPGESAQPAS
jgi:acyl carrier protein